VLVDFGDVIVHLFAPPERVYYNLEGLWAQGVSVVHIQ
jgi:ribosome-associated protein